MKVSAIITLPLSIFVVLLITAGSVGGFLANWFAGRTLNPTFTAFIFATWTLVFVSNLVTLVSMWLYDRRQIKDLDRMLADIKAYDEQLNARLQRVSDEAASRSSSID